MGPGTNRVLRLFSSNGRGALVWGNSLSLGEEYRRNALECFRRAQDAPTLGDRTAWLSMAQLWLQFARHAEDQEAMDDMDAGAKGDVSMSRSPECSGSETN